MTKSKKKSKSFIFMSWCRNVLIKLSQDDRCAKFWVLLKIFNFWSKFLILKGVSPRNKWLNPKKLKFSSLMVWWREVLIKVSNNEWFSTFWVLMEIFNFWPKILNFKGVSPRNERQNRKKKYFLMFMEWWKEVLIKLSNNDQFANFISVVGNFQLFAEILEF